MTVEQMVAALEEQGWSIWNLGRSTKGSWTCRIYDAHLGSRLVGQRGPTSYDLECWRYGTGPTMLAAIAAAGGGLLSKPQPEMEEALDLAAMLS